MFQPVSDFKIMRSFDFVSANAAPLFEFSQPPLDQARRVVIVWVKKAREHSRGRASPPLIVGYCP
jgi:hypothetical protein